MFEFLKPKSKYIRYTKPPRAAFPSHSAIGAGYQGPPGSASIGWTAAGTSIMLNIDAQPHILIAGASGSGKSSLMHALVLGLNNSSVVRNPRYMFIDLKRVEFNVYNQKQFPPALYEHPARSLQEAGRMLTDISRTIENRFSIMERNNISLWNNGNIYLFIDELADMVIGHKAILQELVHIAQIGRAAGVHIIAATQVPSRSVIPTLLQVNMPCHIALRVRSTVESRIILGTADAITLSRPGDMIIQTADGAMITGRADYYSHEDVIKILQSAKTEIFYK